MGNNKSDTSMQKELDWIRALAEVLNETGLTEIEIEKEDISLRVARGAAPAPQMLAAAPANIAPAPDPAASTTATSHPGTVRSPMVGTAYAAPAPGADNFVKVGDSVREGQTLMIIEAMKTMNEIKAPRAGTVLEILAQDSEPVEFDEPLMIIN